MWSKTKNVWTFFLVSAPRPWLDSTLRKQKKESVYVISWYLWTYCWFPVRLTCYQRKIDVKRSKVRDWILVHKGHVCDHPVYARVNCSALASTTYTKTNSDYVTWPLYNHLALASDWYKHTWFVSCVTFIYSFSSVTFKSLYAIQSSSRQADVFFTLSCFDGLGIF